MLSNSLDQLFGEMLVYLLQIISYTKFKMRKQTELTLTIHNLSISENLSPDPSGYIIKVFLSCSQANTKIFKIHSPTIKLNQTLKIKNINAREVEFWLCTTYNKIIVWYAVIDLQAVAKLDLANHENAQSDSRQFNLQLKMLNTQFGKIQGVVELRSYQIQKKVIIDPDEDLLKKVEDPLEKKRKQEQQVKKAKQAFQAAEAAKNVKKHAVTVTRFNKKDQPFV